MKWICALLLVMSAFLARAEEKVRFASIFSDNMVLQQQSNVNFWGYAAPNEKLLLSCSWLKSGLQLVSGTDGRWTASVKTPTGGFIARSASVTDSKGVKVSLSNILIGEVWLCSGQSNMEMILKSQPDWNMIVENSETEIAGADYPHIRFVNIQRKESFFPQEEVISNGWKVCTPGDVKWLSAIGYFFAKKLTLELHMPVGLIISAYGGSPIQSWIPEEVVNTKNIYGKEKEDREAELKASGQSQDEYVKAMSAWIADGETKNVHQGKTGLQRLTLPVNFEKSPVGNQQGEVSLSRKIEITSEMAGQDLKINLGTMDDLGRVFFNGERVWEEIRNSKSYSQVQFTIPAGKVRAGTSLVEARVLNILWGGGLTGPSDNMFYTVGSNPERKSLAGEWQYRKIFEMADAKPLPGEGKPTFSTLSALYNGMIFPLRHYGIKGCLFYQGESNVGEAQRYAEMFTDMIGSWRKSFNNEFPIYYVQIAPYQYGGNQDSKAAELREAQDKVEKTVAKTGMVVTMDIGNPVNIHPAKKMEVGNRLCNLALAETYNKNIPYKSPSLKKARRKGDAVVLTFLNTYKGLTGRGDHHAFELSGDGKLFFPASIHLLAKTITVSSSQVTNPRYVRYCWGDASKGTIFNAENLPLPSFRAEVSR